MSVHCSVQCQPDLQIYQISFEPSNEQIQKWNSQFVTKEIFPVGSWKIFWLNWICKRWHVCSNQKKEKAPLPLPPSQRENKAAHVWIQQCAEWDRIDAGFRSKESSLWNDRPLLSSRSLILDRAVGRSNIFWFVCNRKLYTPSTLIIDLILWHTDYGRPERK